MQVAGKVPKPFPVPSFRQSTEENFSNNIIADDDRKYVVLATMLCTHVQRPSMSDCEIVARSLVAKNPFLKQYVSIVQFFLVRGAIIV